MIKLAWAIGLTAVTLAVVGAASGDAGPMRVLVTNTTSQPVPFQAVGTLPTHEQGTANVSVTNTNLPVHEEGTANVNVTNPTLPVHEQGTASVNIANDAGHAVPVVQREPPT
jgi:hypothetical protein